MFFLVILALNKKEKFLKKIKKNLLFKYEI